MATYAVIMAGGSGTRFWPLSRKARPKQLLALGPGPDSLLAETVRRIRPLVAESNVFVVTAAHLVDAVAECVPGLPRDQILGEPVARNTAPCIGWAAATIARKDPAAAIMVLPSDHHIGDEPRFLDVLARALSAASGGDLVTVGIEPTRPETGYGYLEKGASSSEGVFECERFVEKPDRARAETFLASGRYLWNSGMFFFRADAILGAIRATLPALADGLDRFDVAARADQEAEVVATSFGELPNISIDHGVMEKSGGIRVVPGAFGWSDLGSYQVAWELSEKDAEGNSLPEDAIAFGAAGNFVRTDGRKLVALIGVEDLVVIDTADCLLVVPRSRDQEVKKIVEELQRRGGNRT